MWGGVQHLSDHKLYPQPKTIPDQTGARHIWDDLLQMTILRVFQTSECMRSACGGQPEHTTFFQRRKM